MKNQTLLRLAAMSAARFLSEDERVESHPGSAEASEKRMRERNRVTRARSPSPNRFK
jgi:hypothetical protein